MAGEHQPVCCRVRRAAARTHTQVRTYDREEMHEEAAISAVIDFSSDTHPLARYDFVDFELRDERPALPISNPLATSSTDDLRWDAILRGRGRLCGHSPK
jgi:hypothetical protein